VADEMEGYAKLSSYSEVIFYCDRNKWMSIGPKALLAMIGF
jgi:hypothetical protein